VKTRLHDLPGWALREGKLHREYKFGGFAEAFGFMSTCALVEQKQDHHPEWFNVFNRVVVDLTTDDAGGISALDFALALEMEKAASLPRRDPLSRERYKPYDNCPFAVPWVLGVTVLLAVRPTAFGRGP
jgi:4a-hydroxytetrahydrobiopterin dehydratase